MENVFLAGSPRIRPDLGGYLLAKINTTKDNILAGLNFNFTSKKVAEVKKPQEAANLLKNSLKPVTKGVSAASKDGYSYTEFKLDEIEWAEITYTLKNGQTITIQYPKGTEPPPQAIYEGERE